MIKSQVYPHHSDVDWEEYVEWVENRGGSEWFQEEEEEEEEKFREAQREEQLLLPGDYEAQTPQRTAYLCQDMVHPCSTPLDGRIVTLAHLVSRDTKEASEISRPGLDPWSRMVRSIINGHRQTPIMATDI